MQKSKGSQPLEKSSYKKLGGDDVATGDGQAVVKGEPVKVISGTPKAKEMETLALISALMLTVAGGGLFADSGLEEKSFQVPYMDLSIDVRGWSVIMFCASAFSFMTCTMISSVLTILLLAGALKKGPTWAADVQYGMGCLWHSPKAYFLFGYVTMVFGTTSYFLCLVPPQHTWACLAFCTIVMIFPNFLALFRAYTLMPS